LDWLGIENRFLGFCLILSVWLLSVCALASFVGFFAAACRLFRKNAWVFLLAMPSLWIIFEYLRAWGFSFLFLGGESLLGPHWTFGDLGYLWSFSPFLGKAAGLGGLYFLSFLLVFFNTVFYLLIKKLSTKGNPKEALKLVVLVVFSLFLSGYFINFVENEKGGADESLEVTVLNTDFSFNRGDQLRDVAVEGLLEKIIGSSENPRIVVLPEGVNFLGSYQNRILVEKLFASAPVLIIDSGKAWVDGELKNRIVFFDSQKGVLGYQEKIFLMPAGEYLPYLVLGPVEIFSPGWLDKFNLSRNFQKGEAIKPASFSDIGVGGLLCGEIISPGLYRGLSKGAEIIFNMGNHSSFGEKGILSRQIQSMAQLRAAENNRYLVRAANADFSYIIDNQGRLEEKSQVADGGLFTGKVALISKESFYNRFGDWILIAALFFLLLTKLRIRSIIHLVQIK